jgi:cytochrome P450
MSATTWTDFDPFAAEVRADPYPYFASMREHAPCAHLDRYDVWLVSRYDDVARVLHDWQTFSSGQGAALEPVGTAEEGGVILSTDPPRHTRIRRAVSRDFTPKMIASLEPQIRSLAQRAIDDAVSADEVDWIALLAQPLPTTIMAQLMGYPDEHRDQYCRWAEVIFDSMGCPASESGADSPLAQVGAQLYAFAGQLASNHEYVHDGWADRIVQSGKRGELTSDEVLSLLGGILVAAMDTTVNMLGNLLHSLATHPEQWQRLAADPALAASAVNESLRFESPVQPGFFRVATQDTEIAGVAISRGARVMVGFGSANRDGDQFPDPDAFLVDRKPNQHLAFGRGVHFCLGAPVARLMGKVVLETLCDGVRTIELAGEPVRKDNRMLRGFDELPLRFKR